MNSASRWSLEPESSSDRSVDSGIGCLLATESVVGVYGTARNLSNFGVELEKQKVHGQIGKNVGTGQILRNRDRTRVRGWTQQRPGCNVRTDIGRRIVLVLTDSSREPEENQTLAGGYAASVGLQAKVVDVE